MVSQRKNKRLSDKERENQKRADLHDNEQGYKLLDLYGLSLIGDMNPKFGANIQVKLHTHQGEAAQIALPTLENLAKHLGFAESQGFNEIQSLELPDKYRNRLLEDALKRAKSELNRYLTKVRPFLLELGSYLYTIPLSHVETVVETGDFKRGKSTRVLCALPLSRQIAEQYGYSEEEVKMLAPQLAWLIPQLIVYGKVKDADKLIVALDGWRALLTSQQQEQLHTLAQKHDRHVINGQVTQLLLFSHEEQEKQAS